MLTAEQIVASHKANLETLFGLTTKAFEGVEKLVELNLTASKAALAEAAGTTQAMLSVKDAQELMALQSGLLQPLAEKTAAYSRHLLEITTGTTSEFTKATNPLYFIFFHRLGVAAKWRHPADSHCPGCFKF